MSFFLHCITSIRQDGKGVCSQMLRGALRSGVQCKVGAAIVFHSPSQGEDKFQDTLHCFDDLEDRKGDSPPVVGVVAWPDGLLQQPPK